jgi:hypothetical protein
MFAGILDDTESWGLLAGVVVPLLTAVAQQNRWSAATRQAVAVAVSAVVGVLVCLTQGDLGHGKTVLATVAVVVVAAHVAYVTIWAHVAPAVEQATSPAPPAALQRTGAVNGTGLGGPPGAHRTE